MTTTHGHRVTADVPVPGYVLAHPDCPAELLDAFRALDVANEATTRAVEALDAIRDLPGDHRAETYAAVAAGKKTPPALNTDAIAARERLAQREVQRATAEAHKAARAVEEIVPRHRAILRRLAIEPAQEAADRAARLYEEAKALRAQAEAMTGAAHAIDNVYLRAQPKDDVTAHLNAKVGAASRERAGVHPLGRPGMSNRLFSAWQDIDAWFGMFPAAVPAFAADPLEGEREAMIRELTAEQAKRDAGMTAHRERIAAIRARRTAK